MKELGFHALDVARLAGSEYSDIRIIDEQRENIAVKNGIPAFERSESRGFGVRVIVDGAWGFAASPKLTKKGIQETTQKAVQLAKASARIGGEKVKLVPEPVRKDRWHSTYLIDPFAVPIEKKLELVSETCKIMSKDKRITVAEGKLSFWREHQFFFSSEGAEIEQTILRSGGGISATAVDHKTGEIQSRSYPGVHGGQYMQFGWELIDSFQLVENAERVRDEAVALLYAEPCPKGRMDLIIGGAQMALQIHESFGHPSELDRVLGMEANYAGTSFLTIDKLGNFKYGSELVNIVGDGTIPGGLATVAYDDDGVKTHRWFMVKNGIFTAYLTNRELAHKIGEERSHGANRADGWWSLPMIRMTNISLLPGEWELDDLIASTKNGLLVETNKSWSIDQKRLNFQFTTEIGWLIKNGKKTKLIKNPTYCGITPQFWNSLDAICNEKHWVLYGVPNCGKGQPGQSAEMSHGASPARFRKINVGLG